jgi:hypothetical protein
MVLRIKSRIKDGKEHRYWSIVENHRLADGRIAQRHVLYPGEINDSQKEAWCRSIDILENGKKTRAVSLFPENRPVELTEHEVIHVRVNQMRLEHPRQWGSCWLALLLWDQFKLDRYWSENIPNSREEGSRLRNGFSRCQAAIGWGTSYSADFSFSVALRQVAPGPPARRTVSAPIQSLCGGSRCSMEILHAAGGGRRSIQDSQDGSLGASSSTTRKIKELDPIYSSHSWHIHFK